ncbi:UNKNOWN [Stylonychia lemnae]|uniref:Transmembrane protein n=1 Tax=Stylonychia lemnae TaxID=5949 RepID=A0A077ZT73_STYLE|nr:UNKNOWN [Stylonychia lemnae]|eukprot:CDW73082.1 UNKNOWN [Stylonychia lemnae]
MAMMDKYGQIVGADFTSKVRVIIEASGFIEKQNLYPPILEGTSIFDVVGGIAVISGIIAVGAPGTSYKLVFSSDGIDLSKDSNKIVFKQGGNLEFNIEINLRECEVGEQFTVVGKCQLCQGSYSLTQMTEPGSCEVCPKEKAKCLGGAKIGPLPGYWRRNNKSNSFTQCLYELACLGMIPPKNNILGECLKGYQGILCADCEVGFSRDNDYQCSLCPNPFLNVLRLIAVLAAVIILIVLMIRSTLKGAMEINNVTNGLSRQYNILVQQTKQLLYLLKYLALTAFLIQETLIKYKMIQKLSAGHQFTKFTAIFQPYQVLLFGDQGFLFLHLQFQQKEGKNYIRLMYYKVMVFYSEAIEKNIISGKQ